MARGAVPGSKRLPGFIAFSGAEENDFGPNVEMKRLTKILLIACGMLCVALGVLGAFLPMLPTTPFLLLAAGCFARSSERFYRRLSTNRWCREYIKNYREGRGIPIAQKALAISLLWLTIGYTACFIVSQWWGKLILIGVAVGVTIHLTRIRTYRPQARCSRSNGECDPLDEEHGEANRERPGDKR